MLDDATSKFKNDNATFSIRGKPFVPNIAITLPDTLEEYTRAQVSSGRFSSLEEYLTALMLADRHTQEMLVNWKPDSQGATGLPVSSPEAEQALNPIESE